MFSVKRTANPTINRQAVKTPILARVIIWFFHKPEMPCPTKYLALLLFIVTSYIIIEHDLAMFDADGTAAEITHNVVLMGDH